MPRGAYKYSLRGNILAPSHSPRAMFLAKRSWPVLLSPGVANSLFLRAAVTRRSEPSRGEARRPLTIASCMEPCGRGVGIVLEKTGSFLVNTVPIQYHCVLHGTLWSEIIKIIYRDILKNRIHEQHKIFYSILFIVPRGLKT